MKLIGCDGERKQDGPAPDTVLRNNWSSTGMGKYRLLITFLKLLIILWTGQILMQLWEFTFLMVAK